MGWVAGKLNPSRVIGVTMKAYHILVIVLVGLFLCSPVFASRDDQTGDCLVTGQCKD